MKIIKTILIISMWVVSSLITWILLFVIQSNSGTTRADGVVELSQTGASLVDNALILIPLAMIPITFVFYRKFLSKHNKLFYIISIPSALIAIPSVVIFLKSMIGNLMAK